MSEAKRTLFKVEKEDGLHDVYEARLDGDVIVGYKEQYIKATIAFWAMEPERTSDIPFFYDFQLAA